MTLTGCFGGSFLDDHLGVSAHRRDELQVLQLAIGDRPAWYLFKFFLRQGFRRLLVRCVFEDESTRGPHISEKVRESGGSKCTRLGTVGRQVESHVAELRERCRPHRRDGNSAILVEARKVDHEDRHFLHGARVGQGAGEERFEELFALGCADLLW